MFYSERGAATGLINEQSYGVEAQKEGFPKYSRQGLP